MAFKDLYYAIPNIWKPGWNNSNSIICISDREVVVVEEDSGQTILFMYI